MEIIGTVFILFILFYGSKRTSESTRIMFFGTTLYERRRDPSLPPPRATFALTDGEDDEEEDDDRDLWDRLEAAGFTVIDEERDLRLTDVGALVAEEFGGCDACGGDAYRFAEVCREQATSAVIGRVQRNPLGFMCTGCGRYDLPGGLAAAPIGTLGPLLVAQPNFFDVLDYFEDLRAGDPKEASRQADLPFLERRRDQLEGELNEVRLAIKAKELQNGQSDPYRDTQKAVP